MRSRSRTTMPTAPMWTGARLAAVGIAEGLGASMTLLYGRLARRHNCAKPSRPSVFEARARIVEAILAQFDVTTPRSQLVDQAGVVRLARQPGRGWLVGGGTIAAALLLWYVLTSLTGIIGSYRLPSPPEFLAALRQIAVDGYAGGTLLQQTLQSLKIVIEGFLVAC